MEFTTFTKEQISEEFLNFLSIHFFVPVNEIELDKSLVDTGIIDSIGLIEIAAYIKDQYNIKVTEDQMNRKNFGSVLNIVDFIVNKLNE